MTDTRIFSTIPANAIGDSSLTSLDLRCLAAISIHDGMSLIKETGAGCYAALSTLARKVGTDVTNFSKSLSKLIRKGYVVKEPQLHDKRRSTLRVVFPRRKDDRPDGEKGCTPPEPQGPNDNYDCGAPAEHAKQLVGDDQAKNVGIPGHTGTQYISLNEEIDSEETGKEISTNEELDSGEAGEETRLKAHITVSAPKRGGNEPAGSEEKESAAWLTPSLASWIRPGFCAWNHGAQIIKIERAIRSTLDGESDLPGWAIDQILSFLSFIHDLYPDENKGQQAFRLYEELSFYEPAQG